jgi:hypothetical protein
MQLTLHVLLAEIHVILLPQSLKISHLKVSWVPIQMLYLKEIVLIQMQYLKSEIEIEIVVVGGTEVRGL